VLSSLKSVLLHVPFSSQEAAELAAAPHSLLLPVPQMTPSSFSSSTSLSSSPFSS
jgi:hypothetical protein